VEREGVIEVRLQPDERLAGQVRAEGSDIASGDVAPGRYACLMVRDNGVGMDKKTMERVFEPFFTTKPAGKGTGIGMAVVYGIVQEHGANIEVHSVCGEGTTFRVYFPTAPAALAPTPGSDARAVISSAGAAPESSGSGKHVLYVDDDESIVFLMTRMLERQGYRVSAYVDPKEALAAARANPDQYDIAVTDFNMPGMSGLALATALREIRPDLPVLLASGYITEELRRQAPAAGVRELMYKPNTADELFEAVARFANAQYSDRSIF